MEAAAKLITSIAALLNAIVWPFLIVVLALAYRKEISSFVSRLPALLDRIRKFEAPFIKGELDSLASKASEQGEITPGQVRTATKLAEQAERVGDEFAARELRLLCLEYDALRRAMPPSRARTQEMTRIIVQMRALALSASSRVEAYKASTSAGDRLAAIAMMQMNPVQADVAWLGERFRAEAPFVFYHAALALVNGANSRSGQDRAEALAVARTALDTVRSFEGVPDQNTLQVLEALVPPP